MNFRQGNVYQNHLKDSLRAAIFATMKMTDNDKWLEKKRSVVGLSSDAWEGRMVSLPWGNVLVIL